ncbi:MAG: hypothetical protein ABI663_15110 [Chryseolinea sp.]
MLNKQLLLSILIFASLIHFAKAQDRVLSPDKMLKLVPNQIKGFQQRIDPKALQMNIGTLTYALCEKNFNDGKRSVKILLFDFKEASIMYSQATRKWSNQLIIESDSLVERSLKMTNCSGWESFSRQNQASQIFLGICDRFFLTMTGENVKLDELRSILNTFPLQEFPK